jgi:glutamine cyclotransferase
MSDGTSTLRFMDATDYKALRQIVVRDGSKEITNINELEAANGFIYANVWLTDKIAVINPISGKVVAWLDLSKLKTMFSLPANWDSTDNVLNGIAYDPKSKHFYVTGKRWPALFEIAIDKLPRVH